MNDMSHEDRSNLLIMNDSQPSRRFRGPSNERSSSSLPQTFVSSLRQLFSILDKTASGSVPIDVFKRSFQCSTSMSDFLNELQSESNSTNHLITFDLLLNAIERSLLPPPKQTASSTVSNPIYYTKKNAANLTMIRAVKRYENERNLLIQTCDMLDQVKYYLGDRLVEMREKQKTYCSYLSRAEKTGLTTESMYNRDLIADLLKLANTVIEEVDFNKPVNRRLPSKGFHNLFNKELKVKDEHIQRLETEKRILLKELVEMRHQQGTIIPMKIS